MPAPETLRPERRQIALYFAVLMLTLGLADPLGIVNLPILFLLKDTLGLRPPAVAAFEAIVLFPLYFGFLFGFLRDRWQPFGLGDRGYLLFSAPLAVAGYLWLATQPLSYASLLAAVFLIMVAFQFMDTATHALISVVGQRHQMTGRLSAVVELLEMAPKVIAMLLGGWMASHASSPVTFLLAAAVTVLIGVQALWRPRSIFVEKTAIARVAVENGRAALGRLLRHKPLWPTAAILLCWNFASASGTPLLYYLTNDIGIPSEAFGVAKAAHLACIAVTALLYGILSRRRTLRQMIWWGVVINILPGFLYLPVDTAAAAIGVSALTGLACGVGNIAVFDLLLRSCPPRLEGSAMMLGFSALTAAEAAGDVLGSLLFEQGGFMLCLIADGLAALCILPLLASVPAGVMDSHEDWEPAPEKVKATAQPV